MGIYAQPLLAASAIKIAGIMNAVLNKLLQDKFRF